MKGNKFDFIFNPPKPDLFFNDVKIDPEHEYHVILIDVTNPQESQHNNNYNNYLCYDAMLIKGFEHLGINMNLIYKLNFPIQSFQIAWSQAPNRIKFDNKTKYDCNMKFKRISKKKLRIIERKFMKV